MHEDERAILPLSDLVARGGVYYNVGGSTPAQAITEAVSSMELPKSVGRDLLLGAILERESLMPTAIGNGIAIPHPRKPIVDDPESQQVSVLFLKKPIPYNAADGLPVSVLLILLTANARNHLAVLSTIAHLSRKSDFTAFIAQRPSTEELVEYMRKVESSCAQQ